MKKQASFLAALLIVVGFVATGCASIFVKETRSFKTTGLFPRSCTKEERGQFSKKFVEITKDKQERKSEDCIVTDIEFMVQKFHSILEMNKEKGIPGDTIQEVRDKGFKIYRDEERGIRVLNTRALFGDEALAALGMSVGGGTRDQDAESTSNFKGRHYGEAYEQEDVFKVIDVICINTRNELVEGNTYTFVIVWRDGHVLRRVIKGGSMNNLSSEHAILLCPADAIGGTVDKGIDVGIKKGIR